MKKLCLALLVLLSLSAQAGTEFLTVGMGRKVLSHEPFERFLSVGWKTQGELQFKAEGGFWLDYANAQPVTGFASAAGGYELRTQDGKYLSAFIGPCGITQTDAKLGSLYQFHIQFGAGVKMDDGKALGLIWSHFSNAGIVQPNIGRDLIAVELQY